MSQSSIDADRSTLPAWLATQARRNGQGIALRQKRLGRWQPRTWASVFEEVSRLATALAGRGFVEGDTLLLLTHPRSEALLLSLAAQWLGGVASPISPAIDDAALARVVSYLPDRFIFAEGQQQVDRLLAAGVAPRLLAFADGRGLQGYTVPGLASYADLLPPSKERATLVARSDGPAFLFHEVGPAGNARFLPVSHEELLSGGHALVLGEKLGPHEEALAARAFAAGGQARYLLAPWLIAGFALNFPENIETRDNDRREIGPTLVAGTRETYGRLFDLVRERLPEAGSLSRRLVDWGLQAHAGWLSRSLSWWLVRRPLRDVLGFTRTRSPLLVGAPLAEEAAAFFANLGVQVRHWPEPDSARWLAPGREPITAGNLAELLRRAGFGFAERRRGARGQIQWEAS